VGLTFAALLLLSAPGCSNPHVAAALALYRASDQSATASMLQRAIEHRNNCREDLFEIYRLKALITGDEERARRTFEIVLALDPSYRPAETGDGAPIERKILWQFRDALQVPVARRRLTLDATARENRIEVALDDPLRIVDMIRVSWVSADGSWKQSISKVEDVTIGTPPAGQKPKFYVEAIDRWGGVLIAKGSASAPLYGR